MLPGVQLTRFSDLGLRVLMYLNEQDRIEPVTSAEIATQFQVPHNHIIKVVHKLGQLGWIETQRGRHGGLRLAADATRLTLGQVVRTLEGAISVVDCNEPPCVLRHGCSLKGVLDDALEAFYQTLDKHTLADLYKQRTRATLLTLHRKHAAARG
jgi:Rrf2 family nitric oxide-sensitive transcriptional repressor